EAEQKHLAAIAHHDPDEEEIDARRQQHADEEAENEAREFSVFVSEGDIVGADAEGCGRLRPHQTRSPDQKSNKAAYIFGRCEMFELAKRPCFDYETQEDLPVSKHCGTP